MTRWLVRRTVGRRGRTTAAIGLLKAGIRLGCLAPMSTFSRGVCSAMANVLYWEGVAQELGCGRSLCARLEARTTAPPPQALPAPRIPMIRLKRPVAEERRPQTGRGGGRTFDRFVARQGSAFYFGHPSQWSVRRVSPSETIFQPPASFARWNASMPQWLNVVPR